VKERGLPFSKLNAGNVSLSQRSTSKETETLAIIDWAICDREKNKVDVFDVTPDEFPIPGGALVSMLGTLRETVSGGYITVTGYLGKDVGGTTVYTELYKKDGNDLCEGTVFTDDVFSEYCRIEVPALDCPMPAGNLSLDIDVQINMDACWPKDDVMLLLTVTSYEGDQLLCGKLYPRRG
jgi:hypothetical protein